MKFYKYIASAMIALFLIGCDDDVVAKRQYSDNDQLTIQHKFGMNLVGRVTVDGKPRQGVVVSDGINVMTTDENGEYQMYTTGRQHVFISVPEDCEVPVLDGEPKFYKTLDFTNETIIQRDFALTSCAKKSEWTLFTMADPQLGTVDQEDFADIVLPEMINFTSTISGNVYGISLGDIVWNTPSLYSFYKQNIHRINIPTFSVIGNHDHNEGIKNDTESDADFRDALGPTYYSANIGDCHLVVLDDILYSGASGRNDYKGEITEQQLEWLKKDLSYVSKDKMLIVGLHIPTKRRNSTTHLNNNQDLYDIIKDFKEVQILSGHSHNQYTTTIADNITETTFGAVMGAYWYTLCNDGSPRGYAVLKFRGNELADKYYVGSGLDKSYQMKLYKPEDAVLWNPSNNPGDPYDKILINLFCWHDTWTVEVQEDGDGWKALPDDARLIPSEVGGKCWDPDIRKCLNSDGEIPANHGGSKPEDKNDHMFLYKPADGWKSVSVRATDPYGNVYTETLTN